jgi:hypothetical protein
MIKAPNASVEAFRVAVGPLASSIQDGNNGCFSIPHPDKDLRKRLFFICIISDVCGWDHVSITLRRRRDQQPARLPTWDEMCWIKSLFFNKDEAAVQYHPAEADYVNMHEFTLHLFRPQEEVLPMPPTWLIGCRLGQTIHT